MTTKEVRKRISEIETDNKKLKPLVKENKRQSFILMVVAYAIFMVGLFTTPRLLLVATLGFVLHIIWDFKGVNKAAELKFNEHMIEVYHTALNIAPHIAVADHLERVADKFKEVIKDVVRLKDDNA